MTTRDVFALLNDLVEAERKQAGPVATTPDKKFYAAAREHNARVKASLRAAQAEMTIMQKLEALERMRDRLTEIRAARAKGPVEKPR